MKSMTGFGRAFHQSPRLEIEISVKAVNGRFLETRMHVPREYVSLEAEFKKTLGKKISRGTVDIYVNRRPGPKAEVTEVRVHTALAKKWLKGYQTLAKELKIKQTANLEMIARLPDVLQLEDRIQLDEDEKKHALKTLGDAVDACDKEREREGAALQKELLRLLSELENCSTKISALRAEANHELERKFRERLERLRPETAIDDQRLAQEIVLLIDRADINEEIQRLREHIAAYRDLLKGSGVQGKKLDFYAQELLREVNTIGSKSQVAALTSVVVEAKTIVERIREQVQNTE